MTDRVFFPLVALIAVAMVAIAAWRPPETCPTGSISVSSTYYKVIPINGVQLNRFVTNDYLEKAACQAEADYILSLSAPSDTVYPPSPDIGPHFRLAPDIEGVFSGNRIKILIEARGTGNGGAFEMNYYSGPEGSSGWQQFELASEYGQHVFDYEVPSASQDQGVDFLAIRPVSGSTEQSLEIRDVTFLVLSLMTGEERQQALSEHVDP